MGRKIFFFFSFLLLSASSIYCLSFVCGYALSPENIVTSSSKTDTINVENNNDFDYEKKSDSSVYLSESAQVSSYQSEITAASKGSGCIYN